ncbi:hypothetical protein FOZ63_031341 [Perkinsus olseni]|uniref:Uncharacterized protein n=2 Tax=Perkinsus olseni TaxID=32597 RepID=A0A7J6SQ51_PEROL|nr:hypothetical protein FOZ63_031341 [Perkinsus olseni]
MLPPLRRWFSDTPNGWETYYEWARRNDILPSTGAPNWKKFCREVGYVLDEPATPVALRKAKHTLDGKDRVTGLPVMGDSMERPLCPEDDAGRRYEWHDRHAHAVRVLPELGGDCCPRWRNCTTDAQAKRAVLAYGTPWSDPTVRQGMWGLPIAWSSETVPLRQVTMGTRWVISVEPKPQRSRPSRYDGYDQEPDSGDDATDPYPELLMLIAACGQVMFPDYVYYCLCCSRVVKLPEDPKMNPLDVLWVHFTDDRHAGRQYNRVPPPDARGKPAMFPMAWITHPVLADPACSAYNMMDGLCIDELPVEARPLATAMQYGLDPRYHSVYVHHGLKRLFIFRAGDPGFGCTAIRP